MIGFHKQGNVDGWPAAVAQLPPGTLFKQVDEVQALAEAKSVNPDVVTIARHWYDDGQIFNPGTDWHQMARDFFATWIDGTFKQYAAAVDYVEEFNEYHANSHNDDEKAMRAAWANAVAQVWAEEYRTQPELAHIKLILANTAVGNDPPLGCIQAAVTWGAVMGYHGYTLVQDGATPDYSWQWYGGRFAQIDSWAQANGIDTSNLMWAITEMGPVGYQQDGGNVWLMPNDGWRHPNVCNGNVDQYITAVERWAERVAAWNATNGQRCMGGVLFTSGGGAQWQWFETKQPEMDAIAAHFAAWTPTLPPAPPPPPPPVEPPPAPPEPTPEPPTVEVKMDVLEYRIWQNRPLEVFNPKFGLAQRIMEDGRVPMGPERTMHIGGQYWPSQMAVDPAPPGVDGARYVYYGWPDIRIVAEQPATFADADGTDVSVWQGVIDWAKMTAAGASFCYMRGSMGKTGLDTRFETNWTQSKQSPIYRGMYHLFNTLWTPRQNVDNILAVVDQFGPGELPVALDVEPLKDSNDNYVRINGDRVHATIELAECKLGYTPLVYTGDWVLGQVDGDKSWYTTHPRMWLASYWNAKPEPGKKPSSQAPAGNIVCHQWTSSLIHGPDWGVSSAGLDVNLCYDLSGLLV